MWDARRKDELREHPTQKPVKLMARCIENSSNAGNDAKRPPKKRGSRAAEGDAKRAAFLVAYERLGVVGQAAQAAGCDRTSYWRWLKEHPEFAAAFEAVRETAHANLCERLEAEADRRAVQGVTEGIYQGGKLVGAKQNYSDVLLIFRMKAEMPDKYRERHLTEYRGSVGVEHKGQVTVHVVEREDWYGPRIHDRVTGGLPSPAGDPALAGAVQGNGRG